MRSLLAPLAYRCGWLAVISALAACGIVAYLAGQWAGSMGGAVALAVALTAGVTAWLVRRLDDLRGPQFPSMRRPPQSSPTVTTANGGDWQAWPDSAPPRE